MCAQHDGKEQDYPRPDARTSPMPGGGNFDPWNNPSGPDQWISNPYRCQKYRVDLKDRLEDRSISQPLEPGYPEAPPADLHGATTSGPRAH